jgi:hypothetical protein
MRVIKTSDYRLENQQEFVDSPTLGELNMFLKVIWEEMTQYQVWPVS